MARHYGGWVTGNEEVEPTAGEAEGAWIASTEGYRQTALGKWPPPPLVGPAASVPAGSQVYAMHSGAVFIASGTGNWIIPDNQLLDRLEYPSLNEVIGQTYGGDNGFFFAAPSGNVSGRHFTPKDTAISGAANFLLGAKLPNHTHTFAKGDSGNNPTGGLSPGGNQVGSNGITRQTDSTGGDINRPKSKEAYPIVATQSTAMADGCAFPWLLPVTDQGLDEYLSLGPSVQSVYYYVCSGQDVNRADEPNLFQAIGTLYGAGDGSTTFTLPDLRGVFIQNKKFVHGENLPAGNTFLSDEFGRHYHNCQTITSRNSDSGSGGGNVNQGWSNPGTGNSGAGDATESRPDNIAVVWLIQGG